MLVIIDYGCGNLESIRNMLKKVGCIAQISSNPDVVSKADKLILPGVGSFDHGMYKLEELGLLSVLNQRVITDKIPILGICLGVQLFCEKSDEGEKKGLSWIDADVVSFDLSKMNETDKVPHMGWADTRSLYENQIIPMSDDLPRYYYAHSYHLQCRKKSQILSTSVHGYEFVTAIAHENIMGVQFHPEKSHRFGLALLKNFVNNF